MVITTFSMLLNCSLVSIVFALALALLVVSFDQLRKTIRLSLIDGIEIYTRWQQILLDLRGQAMELHHKGKILEAQADQAQMGIREQRLKLLAVLETPIGPAASVEDKP